MFQFKTNFVNPNEGDLAGSDKKDLTNPPQGCIMDVSEIFEIFGKSEKSMLKGIAS